LIIPKMRMTDIPLMVIGPPLVLGEGSLSLNPFFEGREVQGKSPKGGPFPHGKDPGLLI
jgi:hypothetical protein